MFKLPFFGNKENTTNKNRSIKPVVLLILDGWGIAPDSSGNAITLAKTPNMDKIISNYPHGNLIASGEAVGLPANEVGNTEVGHLTMGAGRVILQDLKRIAEAINDGTFYTNPAFIKAAQHVKKNNSALHIAGLVGTGHVHSSLSHLYALLQFCKASDIKKVYLHLFTDGRDSPPTEGIDIISTVEKRLESIRLGQIATICGRYYGMDRDRRWDRTAKAYNAIVSGIGNFAHSPIEAINLSYKRNITDEFIEPTVILNADNRPVATVNDNDAFIFMNFRVDRPRQLTMSLVLPDFENLKSFDFGYTSDVEKTVGEVSFTSTFKREKWPSNLFFVSMTEFQKGLPVSAVAFPPIKLIDTISEVISKNNLKQLHMAESEKERFVTYYFGGLSEKPFPNEDRNIVPSPKIPTYDKKPEMSVFDIVSEFRKAIDQDVYSFFVINFANADMVGHTGNIEACVRAVEFLDRAIGEVYETILKANGVLVITADHGNAEQMITYPNKSFFFTTQEGVANTDHSNNPVPVVIVNEPSFTGSRTIEIGALRDIAPTILTIMKLSVPGVMSGKSLLPK